jgi:hypothetical protein
VNGRFYVVRDAPGGYEEVQSQHRLSSPGNDDFPAQARSGHHSTNLPVSATAGCVVAAILIAHKRLSNFIRKVDNRCRSPTRSITPGVVPPPLRCLLSVKVLDDQRCEVPRLIEHRGKFEKEQEGQHVTHGRPIFHESHKEWREASAYRRAREEPCA